MTTQSLRVRAGPPARGAVGQLDGEYAAWQALWRAQPETIRRGLAEQARAVAAALGTGQTQLRFQLPAEVIVPGLNADQPLAVPARQRGVSVGGLADQLAGRDLGTALARRLARMMAEPVPATAVSAGLLRHASALECVYNWLPSGRSVRYRAADGDEIETLPAGPLESPGRDPDVPASAYVAAARQFFMPQWVAFDEHDRLLTATLAEAEAMLGAMQRFMAVLQVAVALAPYVVADDAYQAKRYGMLGQLVNQGRALARHKTETMIATIRRRAQAHSLDRGLELVLPYFDDRALQLRGYRFEVIPRGRIMFVPAFVVLAARREQAALVQARALGPATRRQLLDQLKRLERAFRPPSAAANGRVPG